MSKLSPNTLFHFTKSLDDLIGILTNGFYPRYHLEETFAFPMVCFCDIPLSQIEKHIETYGGYGIGMSKQWGVKNKLNPVLYSIQGSILNHNIHEIMLYVFSNQIFTNPRENEVTSATKAAMLIGAYSKPYEGIQDGKKVRFYDEREWRYIPVPDFLVKNEFEDDKNKAIENKKLESKGLHFVPDDIKYIIVKEENEILEMAREIKEIKRDIYNYKEDEVTILTTKIITSKQIEEDF